MFIADCRKCPSAEEGNDEEHCLGWEMDMRHADTFTGQTHLSGPFGIHTGGYSYLACAAQGPHCHLVPVSSVWLQTYLINCIPIAQFQPIDSALSYRTGSWKFGSWMHKL